MADYTGKRNGRTHELPAGNYYIGDPCYVIDDEWDEFLEAWYLGEDWKGRPIAAFSTLGDGTYRDNLGREYPVDASMLAAVPAEQVGDPVKAARQGQFISFQEPFRCSKDRRGRIRFGNIVIETEG